jgi:hypothetical protein
MKNPFETIKKVVRPEKHTQVSFERAAQERARASQEYQKAEGNPDKEHQPEYNKWLKLLLKEFEEARKKAAKLYGKGWEEAHELKERHERLIKEAREALERLVEFEMDKLGMTNEDYEMRKAIDAQKIQE